MPKNCARCRAENVVQASECVSCGAKFGRGLPGTEPPKGGPTSTSSGGCLGWIVVFALLAAGGSWLYGKVTGSSDDDTSSAAVASEPAAADDVKVTVCRVNEFGWGEARVTIVNSTSWRADYFVTVAFESSDGSRRYGDAIGMTRNLDPGQTARVELASTDDFPSGKCRLVEVRRSPS